MRKRRLFTAQTVEQLHGSLRGIRVLQPLYGGLDRRPFRASKFHELPSALAFGQPFEQQLGDRLEMKGCGRVERGAVSTTDGRWMSVVV